MMPPLIILLVALSLCLFSTDIMISCLKMESYLSKKLSSVPCPLPFDGPENEALLIMVVERTQFSVPLVTLKQKHMLRNKSCYFELFNVCWNMFLTLNLRTLQHKFFNFVSWCFTKFLYKKCSMFYG